MKKIVAWLNKDISIEDAVLTFCFGMAGLYGIITLVNIVGGFINMI